MASAHLACRLKGWETRGQLMETKHVCGLEPLCLRGFRSVVGSWTVGLGLPGNPDRAVPLWGVHSPTRTGAPGSLGE